MRAEMGSFSGRGGVAVSGPRGGVRAASSFSAERTGALSFKIGPTKGPRFRPSQPKFSEKNVSGFKALHTTEWKPVSAPKISKPLEKPAVRFPSRNEPSLFAKPRGEKAGIAPYKKTIFTERKAFAQFPAPIEKKSLRVSLPERRKSMFPPKEQVIRPTLARRRVIPEVKPVVRSQVSRDKQLEQRVALAYLNLGLAKDKKEAEKRVRRAVSEKISRLDWQPKPAKAKELTMPRTDWKPKEQRQPIRLNPDVRRRVDALKQVKIVNELRLMKNSYPAIDVATKRLPKVPEQARLQQTKIEKQNRLVALRALVLKKEAKAEEKKKSYYVEDTSASTARINLALTTAAKLFARRFFRDNGRGKITGEKVAAHLPSRAQGSTISKLVRGRQTEFDGSYIEWRDRLAKMGEKKSVGEVVAAARVANESAPPVQATKEKKTREVTMKDVLRVLLGSKEDER